VIVLMDEMLAGTPVGEGNGAERTKETKVSEKPPAKR
jgi:hypothetical protein